MIEIRTTIAVIVISFGSLSLGSCAASLASDGNAKVEAISSGSFVIARPSVITDQGGSRVSGAVCRKPNRAVASPPRVEIDHLSADGVVIDQAFAYLAPLAYRSDQRCGHYSARLPTPLGPDDSVRVCFSHVGKTCAPTK